MYTSSNDHFHNIPRKSRYAIHHRWAIFRTALEFTHMLPVGDTVNLFLWRVNDYMHAGKQYLQDKRKSRTKRDSRSDEIGCCPSSGYGREPHLPFTQHSTPSTNPFIVCFGQVRPIFPNFVRLPLEYTILQNKQNIIIFCSLLFKKLKTKIHPFHFLI